jgi:hypothetical protein
MANYFDDAANKGEYNGQTFYDKNKYLQATGYQKSGGGGDIKPYTGYAPGSQEEAVAQSIAQYQKANEPAVASLKASIPEVQKNYDQQRTQLQAEENPLKQRYSQLIDEIKGNQKTAENRQTLTTNAELARRGIGGGNLYDKTLTEAVNPVTQQYTGLLNDTGMAQDKSIRDLVNTIANTYTTQTGDERSIQNAIAQLQSGAASSGIQAGNQSYQTNVAQQYKAAQDAQDQALRQQASDLAQKQFNQIDLPQSQAALQNILSQISKRSSTGSGPSNSSAMRLEDIFN